jgi:RecG-like helicase
MAPTEILAAQHARKLADWLEPLGVGVAWLSGSQTKKEREAALQRVASGQAQLVLGTHAVIQAQVRFARLGLAIVDEQHRFGVAQRLALRDSLRAGTQGSGLQPHLLMMSATPIPRTLAMALFGDLDVSTIDVLPPGRTPVRTSVVSADRRDELIARVGALTAQGRQAYWVCPLVEESETLDLQNAVATHAELSAALATRSGQGAVQVGLLHGRMKAQEKRATMQAFSAGEIGLLVATTVIEVGVDVPNASLMVIEHAERFGLSQLHQLRGRVGRGAAQSDCVLLFTSPLSPTARERWGRCANSPTASPWRRKTWNCAGRANCWACGSRACPACATPIWRKTSICSKPPATPRNVCWSPRPKPPGNTPRAGWAKGSTG